MSGFYHLNDIENRIINEEAFNKKWIKRCANWMNEVENKKECHFK